jgi:hypothetical protein
MKASEQWLLFAKLLEDRAKYVRENFRADSVAPVSVALIGASADATKVAQALEEKGL